MSLCTLITPPPYTYLPGIRKQADVSLVFFLLLAVCLGQHEFKDQYFDSADYALTIKDFWLRNREGSWELKRPTSDLNAEATVQNLCSKYREITDVLQIRAELMAIMDICTEHTLASAHTEQAEFKKWLQDMKLECFAEFTTVRCSYALEYEEDNRRVRVDLDQADFGYCVGEIEVLVSEGVEMKSAMKSIEKTARELGDWSVVDLCLILQYILQTLINIMQISMQIKIQDA